MRKTIQKLLTLLLGGILTVLAIEVYDITVTQGEGTILMFLVGLILIKLFEDIL